MTITKATRTHGLRATDYASTHTNEGPWRGKVRRSTTSIKRGETQNITVWINGGDGDGGGPLTGATCTTDCPEVPTSRPAMGLSGLRYLRQGDDDEPCREQQR